MLFPLASGNWNNAANAGVFYRNWNNNRSNDNNNVGFRVSDYCAAADLTLHAANTGDIGVDLSCTLAKSAWRGFSVPQGTINQAFFNTMPKRHGNLFGTMFTLDALHAAYLKARRRKRKKSNVATFERNLGANLQRLHDELHNGTYQPRPYKTFEVHEPKRRVIYAPHFRDVVVQHAMYAVLFPIMDAGFCHDSWGCRVGKGTHGAADRAQQHLRASRPGSYILQLDVRKFFYRIDRGILTALWSRKIKDQRVLSLLDAFAHYPNDTGIPIGNLLSQLGALVYLNPLDHFIKRELGIAKYVRYVDDFILFDLDREQAHQLREHIEAWLTEHLRLELSKWTIHPVKRGINFVGFRTWRKTRFVRKYALCNFSRALRRGKTASVVSALGHARHTASFIHMARRCAEVPAVLEALPPIIQLSFRAIHAPV